jgi:WD40 repeat protein/serine/threonine protein kinase
MLPISACPAVPDLQRLLLGPLPDREAEDLEQHLLQCNSCLQTLKGLPGNDTLVEAFRAQAAAGPRPPSTLVTELIRKLEGLRPPAGAGTTTDATGPHTDGASGSGSLTDEAYDFLAPPQGPDEVGRLGPYRVLRVLGAGGMGVVFLAEDPQLRRPVALKAMKPALAASASARRRFLREAQTAAAIKHDHIVTIYQVGEDRSIPFLAMELLDGETLEDRLRREGRLPLSEVLRIGREAAEGLAAAHARGLVHRDIKPGNLWLEETPAAPGSPSPRHRVKILDFGLARAASDESQLTGSGVILGTPAYMAPEQARGEAVDHRCDLFSLGCILYRMGTGRLPFSGTDSASPLLALVTEHPAPPRQLNPDLPPALNTLILRLLAKNLADRPSSARAVVEGLAAIEHGARPQPGVGASPAVPPRPEPTRPPGVSSAARPAAGAGPAAPRRRWRLAVAAAVLLGLLGAAGYLAAPTVLRVATNQGELVIETDDPNIEVTVKEGTATIHDRTTQRRFDLKAGKDYEIEVIEGPEGVRLFTKKFTLTRGGRVVVNVRLEMAEAPRPAEPGRGSGGPARVEPVQVAGPADALRREQIPPAELAEADGGDPKKAPAELVAVLGDSRLKHWGGVTGLAFSPDGRTLASASGDGSVKLWDAATGQTRRTFRRHKGGVSAVAYSPDGKTLADGGNLEIILRDLATGAERWRASFGCACVAFSPDGKALAAGSVSGEGTVCLLEAATGKFLWQRQGHEQGPVHSVAFSPDGKLFASAAEDGTVQLWDVARPGEHRALKGHTARVNSLAFSPDGKTLASASHDGTVRLWDMTSGLERQALHPRSQSTYAVAFSPDGKRLALGGWDITLWDPATGKEVSKLEVQGAIHALAFSPDGKTLAGGNYGQGVVRLWDVGTGHERLGPHGPAGSVVSVAVSPDGKTIISGATDGTVRLSDLGGPVPRERAVLRWWGLGEAGWAPNALALSPDGKTLVLPAPENFALSLHDMATGKEVQSFRGHRQIIRAVAFSPDGRTIVSGSHDGTVRLWDVATGKERRTLQTGDATASLAFSPDGKTLAAVEISERLVRFWDVATGRERHALRTGTSEIGSLVFSPDGKILYGGGYRGLRCWDLAADQEQRTLDDVTCWSLAFSPDGKTLITTGPGGVSFWDPALPEGQGPRRRIALGPVNGWVWHAAFTPDGRHLVTANGNGTVYVLRLQPAPAGAALP